MRIFVFFAVLVGAVHAVPNKYSSAPSEGAVVTSSDMASEDRSICSLPPVQLEGRKFSCYGFLPRWTFNSTSGKCERYTYSGCGKTENLFNDEEACVARCGGALTRAPVSREVCLLPKEPGSCLDGKRAFAFIKEKNRCEIFTYGGCGANANNFQTAEECYQVCGGDTPSSDIRCENVKCNLSLFQYYEGRGCRPQYQPGACCPIRYVCPSGEVENAPSCLYRGVRYGVGDRIPQITEDTPCKVGCYCHGDGNSTEIVCADVECFHPNRFNPDCTPLYDHKSCCPVDYKCPGDNFSLCRYNNTFHDKGAYMPSDDPCKTCRCLEAPVANHGLPVCKDIRCIIELPAPDCVPVYEKDFCCPVDYTCPKAVKRVIKDEQETGTVLFDTLPAAVDQTPASRKANISALITGKINGFQADTDRCSLPKEVGPCRGFKPMFYHDADRRRCLRFEYGGCKGNENRFETYEECQKVCNTPIWKPKNEACNKPKYKGKCRASIRRHYFDAESGTCKKFIFGGCGSNGNNFGSEAECLEACQFVVELNTTTSGETLQPAASGVVSTHQAKSTSPVNNDCKLPVDPGFCRANVTRFYYDDAVNSCKPFTYGGCFGNGNNFLTELECLAACAPDQSSATERTRFDEATLNLPAAPSSDDCSFGNLTLKIGDSFETEDPCVQCTCHTPPVVSCTKQTCPRAPSDPACRVVKEPGQCCPYYDCNPEETDLCADHVCPEGTVCAALRNDNGLYADCIALCSTPDG